MDAGGHEAARDRLRQAKAEAKAHAAKVATALAANRAKAPGEQGGANSRARKQAAAAAAAAAAAQDSAASGDTAAAQIAALEAAAAMVVPDSEATVFWTLLDGRHGSDYERFATHCLEVAPPKPNRIQPNPNFSSREQSIEPFQIMEPFHAWLRSFSLQKNKKGA